MASSKPIYGSLQCYVAFVNNVGNFGATVYAQPCLVTGKGSFSVTLSYDENDEKGDGFKVKKFTFTNKDVKRCVIFNDDG